MTACVLLDRDGVLNVDRPSGVLEPDELVLLDGAARAVARINALGYRVLVVTNQSAVGGGRLAPEALRAIHARLVELVAFEGGHIDGFFVCEHGASAGCACRKPAPGLLFAARDAYGLDLGATYFVGDDQRDLDAAAAAGCLSALVRTGKGASLTAPEGVAVFADLADFVERALAPAACADPARAAVEGAFVEHLALVEAVRASRPDLPALAARVIASLRTGGKVLWMGNGGSAADAQHLAAELVGRFERDRPGLAAIALTTDTSILTAVSNDHGFEQVFARQVEALARPGDVVVVLSTSGNSPNVLRGAEAARRAGAFVIGLTGAGGGKLAALCDAVVAVPSRSAARIQEAHILLGHMLCDLVEAAFAEDRA